MSLACMGWHVYMYAHSQIFFKAFAARTGLHLYTYGVGRPTYPITGLTQALQAKKTGETPERLRTVQRSLIEVAKAYQSRNNHTYQY